MGFTLSVAKTDITPAPGGNPNMAGFATLAGPREATDTNSPLYARCVVIWEDGSPRAIVSADVLAFPRSMHQVIRRKVVALTGKWKSSGFVLAATHTHNGPVLVDELDPFIAYNLRDLSLVSAYSDWLVAEIVQLVQTALDAPRTPVTLDYQVAAQNFSANREGLSYHETAVPILVARGADGLPRAVVFSYGAHPVSGGAQEVWDGDYPAGACSVVEDAIPGSFALFLLGPAGDQDPVRPFTMSLRDQLATDLGDTVAAAAGTAGRPVGGPMTTRYREINLPLDVTNTPANVDALIGVYQARQSNGANPVWYQRHAEVMLQQLNRGTFATSVPLPLQVWKFSGRPTLRLCLTGGELVSGYAVHYRDRFDGAEGLIIGGYASEIPGYICSDELLPPIRAGGSYGGGWDTDFPGIAGGSQTVYKHIGHYLAGKGGIESTLIAALDTLLA